MRFVSNGSRSIDVLPWLYCMLEVFEDGYNYIGVLSEFPWRINLASPCRPWTGKALTDASLAQLQAKWCSEVISSEDDCNLGRTSGHNSSHASKDECLQVLAASSTYRYTVHLDERNVKEHLVHSCLRWHLLELPIVEPVWTSEVASARDIVPSWLLKRRRSSWIHQIFVPRLLRQPWSESEN